MVPRANGRRYRSGSVVQLVNGQIYAKLFFPAARSGRWRKVGGRGAKGEACYCAFAILSHNSTPPACTHPPLCHFHLPTGTLPWPRK